MRGKADALRFPAGKGGHGPPQGNVVKPHVDHEGQPVRQFLDQGFGHGGVASAEGASFKPGERAFHGQGTEIADGQVIHAHGEGFRTQARPAASRAIRGLEVAGEEIPPHVAVLHPALQQRHDAGPDPDRIGLAALCASGVCCLRSARGCPAAFIAVHDHGPAKPVAAQAAFAGCAGFAVEQRVQGFGRVFRKRRGQGEAVPFAQRGQGRLVPGEDLGIGPGQNGLCVERKPPVGRDEQRLEIIHTAEPRTARAGSLGAVEGKQLRAWRGQADAADRADGFRGMNGVGLFSRLVRFVHDKAPFAVAQGQFHRIGQAGAHTFPDRQAIHHQIEAVFLVFVQRRDVVQGEDAPVHAQAGEALGLELPDAVKVRALLQFHQRGHEDHARSLGQGKDIGNDLVRGTGLDGASAMRAVHAPEPGEEDAQKVVNLRHRAHGGAGVAAGGLLFQGNRRRQPLDLVHVRLVHLGQKLPGVGGERFHIAPLPFRIHNVKGQGGLARAGRPADDHKLIARDVQAQVFEVVLARAFDMDAGTGRGLIAACAGGRAVCAGGVHGGSLCYAGRAGVAFAFVPAALGESMAAISRRARSRYAGKAASHAGERPMFQVV